MDEVEKCVEVIKNPQFCSSLYKINQIINSLARRFIPQVACSNSFLVLNYMI